MLDVLVQNGRDKRAAMLLLRKLLKKQGRAPRVLISDKLKSYGAAKKALKLRCEHRQHKGLNNRREQPSADPTTGTADEALQITAAGPALPRHPLEAWAEIASARLVA